MNPEDDTISITLGDTIYTSDNDFVLTGTIADDLAYTTGDTFTGDITNWNWLDADPTIQLGKHTITEQTVEKLQALLDVIDSLEDDNDLKALFNTQLAFNRIKNTDETKSD